MKKIYTNTLLCLLLITMGYLIFFHKEKIASQQIYFAIFPHFTIQENIVDKQYKNLVETYNLSGKKIQILIISPDHYTKENNRLERKNIDTDLCYKTTCMNIKGIYVAEGEKMPTKYIKEHGRGEQFPYIQKYFPNADIYLAKLQGRDFSSVKKLREQFKKLEKNGDLLVLASVDFSHYTEEKRANIHDIKTYYTLANATDIESYKNIEVDCPLGVYITNIRAQSKGQYPNRIMRDSSSTINNKDLGYQNTSRQRYLYSKNRIENNGLTLAFFGDGIFDRRVKTKLEENNDLITHFKDRYQEGNSEKNPSVYIHRKGFGIDFMGFNLETPYVEEGCNAQLNGISFCSSGILLPIIQSLGFSFVTIANNHIGDAGIQGYEDTIKSLQKNALGYAGYIKIKGIEKNNVLTKTIRGMKIAIHGYNFYNRFSGDIDTYCTSLQEYKRKEYHNIVSVHRGTEYETTHNILQENIGKKLIDCGADIIIGHHPHVVQDIERYKDRPIIYSLGNFLFDQYFSEETKKGMYLLVNIPLSGTIQLWTGEIKSTP